MTDQEYNECCVVNPRPGDTWRENIGNVYFVVVERKSLDEIVVLKCFGDDKAKIDQPDGTFSFDYSKAVVVNREWIRNDVTYSSDRTSFVADCQNTEKTRKIVSEYREHIEKNPSFAKLVAEKRKEISELHNQLKQLLETCPHTTLEKKSNYYSGGYDYRSESHKWDECTICGKEFNKTIDYGY